MLKISSCLLHVKRICKLACLEFPYVESCCWHELRACQNIKGISVVLRNYSSVMCHGMSICYILFDLHWTDSWPPWVAATNSWCPCCSESGSPWSTTVTWTSWRRRPWPAVWLAVCSTHVPQTQQWWSTPAKSCRSWSRTSGWPACSVRKTSSSSRKLPGRASTSRRSSAITSSTRRKKSSLVS